MGGKIRLLGAKPPGLVGSDTAPSSSWKLQLDRFRLKTKHKSQTEISWPLPGRGSCCVIAAISPAPEP